MVIKVTEWNDVEKVLNGFGIALRDTAGTFKDADTIISELGENWQTYNSVQKNAIATAVAGTRQREVFYSTMENWEQVGKAARIAADSQGNAAQKMDAYTDSIQAAKNRITAAVEKLTMNINLEGLLKNFYKVTAGLIDNIGLVSTAVAGFLVMTKGKSLMSAIFGDGKFLNNAMYKMMGTGLGTNNQGSIFTAFKDQYGNGQWKKNLNDMANLQNITAIERTIANGSKINSAAVNNFLNLGTNTFGDAKMQAAISKYVLKLDENGAILEMEAQERVQLLNAIKESMTAEEKESLAETILSQEEMEQAEMLAKGIVYTMDLSNATADEIKEMEKTAVANEKVSIALNKYAEVLNGASEQEKRMIANFYKKQTDPNLGSKAFAQGALTTGFMTAGAIAPMAFSKGAGAIGKNVFGVDESTGAMVSMLGMSALGNAAGKNVGNMARAFGEAAKSARLASNTLNASGGLIGAFNTMSTSMKAGIPAMLGVEGAMAGLASAGFLVVGIIAMIVAQARAKAKEARMEAYKDSKAKYDSLIDATATFNDSKYTHLAAGVDSHGNNVSLSDDEYQEFVDMSNKLAEAFPELVTYTDELGNHFLSLGDDAQSLGTKLEEATAAAQRARDRDLLATREDVSKDYEKDVAEKSKDTKMLQNVLNFVSGTVGGKAGKAEKDFIEQYSNLTVKGGKLVNKETGDAATNAEIEHLQNAATAALNDNTAAIRNLTSTYSDFGVAEARTQMGLAEDGTSVYENLPDQTRQMIQGMVSYIPPNAANYEETIGGIVRFAQNFDWDSYNTNMNNTGASADSLHDYREAIANDMISQWGQNASTWSADKKAIAMQLDFEIDDNGNLKDTRDTLQQIYDLAESKGISSDIVDSWGVGDKSVKNAQTLYQYLNEGKISAEATADSVWGLINANSDSKDATKARASALKNVTEDNFADYVDKLLESGERPTLESVTEYFGGIGEETANVIAQEANNMIEASKATSDEHWKNMSTEEKQEAKNTAADQVVADAQAVADAAQKEADAKAKTAKNTPSGSAEKQAAKAAQDKAKAAQKEADATREKAEAYKKEGTTSDRDFGGKVQKKLDENNAKAALDRSEEEQKAKDDNKKNKKKYQKKAIDDTVKEYEKDAQRKQEEADSKQTTSEKKDKTAAKLAEEAKEAEEAYKDLNTQAKNAEKTNAKNAAELKTSAKAAKTIANNKKKEASSAAKTAKSAKTEATNAKKTAKAAKEKANAAKKESKALKTGVDGGKGIKGDSDLAKDSAKAWEKANKQRVKDAKSTGKKLVKENKDSYKKIKQAADSASLEESINKASEAYQQFFSSIQDEDNNGFINTWNEMRQEFELINEEITRTSNALDEQKEYGKLSAQTVLELLSADEDYINVLEVKNGQIQLAANAEEQMAQIKLQAAREQIEADVAELEAKKATIEGILAAGEATDAELESIGAKVEGQNEEINATNASVTASYNAANAALKAAAGYDTAGNAAAAAATKIAAYNRAEAGAKHVAAGSKNTKTNTVAAGTYGSAPTTQTANFKVNKPHKLSKKEIKNLEKQLGEIENEIDVKNALKDGLKDVKGFKDMYTPGGGKDKSGGGGGGGDDYTKLDHVKDILSAINKEYQQMVTYNKALGAGHDIEISYYQKKKKYLEEEIKLLKAKMAKDAKKSNKSDYYQDIQDYQQAKIDLANLDDERIQDQLDLLDARKELTGIAYKYEVSLYKKLLQTADTEQERLEYEKKLIDAQKEQIDNQREIASAMKDTLDLEKSLALAYKGISQGYKKNANGYSYTSDLAGLNDITIKGTDGHTASGVANSINKKREAAVEKAKKKYKYVKVGVDRTGTLQYSYSNKSAATAEKKLASKLTSEDSKMGSDGIDFNEAYITDSFGNKHWYIKSKANTKTAQLIKKYKKNGYYVAVDVDDTGRLHFSKHKKTKKYTKKKAKKKLNASVKTFVDAANVTAEHQDNGGSQQEYNSNVKKTTYEKLVDKDVKKVLSQKAESLGVIDTINKSIDDQIELIKDDMEGILRKRAAVTKGSKEDLELVQEYQEALDSILELEKERVQTRIDMLDAAGINNKLLLKEYEELMKTSKTTAEEWENQKKLNDALKEYNNLLHDTLEYKYALYDNILEYESYTPSKDANSQYMKAINAQKGILEEELKMAKENAETYRKMAFDANVKAYMEYGYSEQEAKDKAWKDSENDSDYQEAVNQYVEAFQKMGELVLRQFTDIADALERRIDKMEQQRAEEWRSTWNGTWDNEGKLITKATDKIKNYYSTINQMQEQVKSEALKTLKDTEYLTDEQVQSLVDKYNEAAVTIHENMINQLQDTVDYQDTLYNAVVDEVNDIIFNLEKQKELTEKMYDDEIESLQKKEDSIQRTNDLLEKEKALRDALNDRQRVYRAGIGWTYEANRDAIKQAQRDLDNYKDEDRLNDLQKAKDDELNELDEKIKNWEDYLTMLEYQYNEYERIERQRLLMEVTGTNDMREVHEYLVDDMENFTDYVKNNQSAFLENAIKAYTNYNTAFSGFLDDYEKNQLRLYDLQGQTKELLNEQDFFKGNGSTLENFINNQLNSNWSDTTKELYDALTGAKYGVSPYAPGDTEQLSAAAAIKQREANGEKVQVVDQNGKYYNSLAEFEKAQATNGDLKIAAYKSDNSKQVGGGVINTNALYDTNTGKAVTTAAGTAVSNALATDNGKTTYINVGGKAVDAKNYDSITLNPDGTATFVDKNGKKTTGELIQLGSNDYGKVTNTTTKGVSFGDLYAQHGDSSIYAIGESGQVLRTATGSYSNGTVTYGGGTQKSGYEIAGGNNGVVDTNSYTDVTRNTTDYGDKYVYTTSTGSDILKMLAKYEGGNVALVDDGNGGVKVVAGTKSTVEGSTYTTGGGTNYQIVGDATSTTALDAAISARTGGKADSSTLSSGGSTVTQMIEKYDNVAYVDDGKGGVRLVGGNNSTITTDKKTGKQYYVTAGGTKYEVVSTVEKGGKGYSEGIKNGPVTYTGLAMLHGSLNNPEYVLNSAQAGQLLYNMATKDMAYESIIEKYATTNNTSGDAFNIGELNVQAESPQEFFEQLMQTVNSRYSTTKNRR